MQGVEVFESVGLAAEEVKPADEKITEEAPAAIAAAEHPLSLVEEQKPYQFKRINVAKQSGISNVKWDRMLMAWQVKFPKLDSKGNKISSTNRVFSVKKFIGPGISEAQADAAALQAAKAFRAELVEKGILSEPKPRDPNFTSEVPGVKWVKTEQKWQVAITSKAGKKRISGGRFTEKAAAEAKALRLQEKDGLQRRVKPVAALSELPMFHPKVPYRGVSWEQRSQQWYSACQVDGVRRNFHIRPKDHSEAELERSFQVAVAWRKKQEKEKEKEGKADDTFKAHTDGHAYGDKFPDYFLLLCAHACEEGGGNFLIDGYEILQQLEEDPETRWVVSALEHRPVNQTSRLPSVTPVLLRAPGQRRALRCRLPGPPSAFMAQRVSEESEDPKQERKWENLEEWMEHFLGDAQMLEIYHQSIQKAADAAQRIHLRPGDALVVDNYRMFHGRDPYHDQRRLLWRCWLWTSASRGLPDVEEGELHSTPGNAPGAVLGDEATAKRALKTTALGELGGAKTKQFRRELTKSDSYFKFGRTQMNGAMENLKKVSGSELLTKIRQNGFKLTVGDITFVLAESYGFCWGVERAVAMAYEARDFFPDKNIWVTNEIIHNPSVNKQLSDKGMKFVQTTSDGTKDYSGVQEGDVVILPAFGASVDEMALFKEKNVQIVDTTCPWVSKVWTSVEKSKDRKPAMDNKTGHGDRNDKGHTAIIHGKYDHEETVATKSFAQKYLVLKNMGEAEYVADYILGNGNKEEFLSKFSKAMSEGFDPDVDLECLGVANQTTMLKGETELIGKLFERTLIKKYGPQNINEHFLSFNTICDATQERQDAMYKMFGAEYEAPKSKLYAELEGEQGAAHLAASVVSGRRLPERNLCAMAAFDRYHAFRNFDGPPGLALGLEEINRNSADNWMQRQISKLQSSSSDSSSDKKAKKLLGLKMMEEIPRVVKNPSYLPFGKLTACYWK
eukprot:s493_g15.t1